MTKRVVLYCSSKDCCPTITIDKDAVIIEDDFGGKAKLTAAQFGVLKEKVLGSEL